MIASKYKANYCHYACFPPEIRKIMSKSGSWINNHLFTYTPYYVNQAKKLNEKRTKSKPISTIHQPVKHYTSAGKAMNGKNAQSIMPTTAWLFCPSVSVGRMFMEVAVA